MEKEFLALVSKSTNKVWDRSSHTNYFTIIIVLWLVHNTILIYKSHLGYMVEAVRRELLQRGVSLQKSNGKDSGMLA